MAKQQARVQTGLRLEPAMIDRLRQSDRGLSDEIRDRLERTFKEDAIDAVTRELRDGLVNIAERLRADYGEWHKSPMAYQAFNAAMIQRIAQYEPPPEPEGAASDLFGRSDTIGRLREHDDRRSHSYPHLETAQRVLATLGRAQPV